MEAGAWSTALMVLGARDGIALADEQGLVAQFWMRESGQVKEHCTVALRTLIAAVV